MKRFAAFVALGVMALVAAGAALAESDSSDPLGSPGTSSCVGRSAASLAQTGAILGSPGISDLAALSGLTVQQTTDAVAAYCASGPAAPTALDAPISGGGAPPSCDDARGTAGALNAVADAEGLAGQAAGSLGDAVGAAIHQVNAQALRAAGQAIVNASCGPQ